MLKLLLDGDVIAWRIALRYEEAIDFGDGLFTWWADFNKAKPAVEFFVYDLLAVTKADDVIICLSDTDNFRKTVNPQYKENRKARYTPLLINPIKQYLSKAFESRLWATLEADDVMGLTATNNDPHTYIIATIDKDLLQIPGQHYNWDKPEKGVFEVSPTLASQFFYQQILSGDAVDGYTGCVGIGPIKAQRIVSKHWADGEPQLWKEIVNTYVKQAKLTQSTAEKVARTQARCARILQGTDYDPQTGRLQLWTPPE